MIKNNALLMLGGYIMLSGILTAILRESVWVSIPIFAVGCALSIWKLPAEKTLFKYSIFILIPIAALAIHLPIPKTIPNLIRLGITMFFWIAVLLITLYTVLAYNKLRDQRTSK